MRARENEHEHQNVYEEFYATPAGKDARKIVDGILAIK